MLAQAKFTQMHQEVCLLLNFVDFVIANPHVTLNKEVIKSIHASRCTQHKAKQFFLSNNFKHNLNLLKKTVKYDAVQCILSYRKQLLDFVELLKKHKKASKYHQKEITLSDLTDIAQKGGALFVERSVINQMFSKLLTKVAQNMFARFSIIVNHSKILSKEYSHYTELSCTLNAFKKLVLADEIEPETKASSVSEVAFVNEFVLKANELCQKYPGLTVGVTLQHGPARACSELHLDHQAIVLSDIQKSTHSLLEAIQKYQVRVAEYQAKVEENKLRNLANQLKQTIVDSGLNADQLKRLKEML